MTEVHARIEAPLELPINIKIPVNVSLRSDDTETLEGISKEIVRALRVYLRSEGK